jgi:hypothetical protein
MGRAQQATDVETTAELKVIVQTRGWPTCTLVGADASDHALLIAGHLPDHYWHQQLLPKLDLLAQNNQIDISQLAMFEDKVLIAEGHKQRYGTQFKFANGKLMMYVVVEPSRLTVRRSNAFLPPPAEYRRMLSGMYHLQETEEVVPPPAAQP